MYKSDKLSFFEFAKEMALNRKPNVDYYFETEKAYVFGASEERMMLGPAPIVIMKDPDSNQMYTMHNAPDLGKQLTPPKYFDGKPLEDLD